MPGRVSRSKDDIALTLFGTITPDINDSLEKTAAFILGETTRGDPLTLYEAQCTNMTTQSSGGSGTTTWMSDVLFVGKHLLSPSDLHFLHCDIGFTNFEEWIGHYPFSQVESSSSKEQYSTTEKFTFPKSMDVSVPAIDATIQTHFSCSARGIGVPTKTYEYLGELRIVPSVSQHFDWYMERLVETRNFFTLLVGQPVYEKRVKVYTDKSEKGISVYYRSQCDKLPPSISQHKMIASLPKVKDSIAQMMQVWFAKQNVFSVLCNLSFLGLSSTNNCIWNSSS